MVEDSPDSEANGGRETAHISWHVRIFPTRKTRRTMLGKRKRVTAGYGWSASGTPEGHKYDPGPYKSFDHAAAAAREALSNQGTISGDIQHDGS